MTDVPERIWWSPANGRLDTSEPETWYTAKMPTYEYVRADLFTALEVGRDDWKQRYETLETWYDNRAKGITALEALNDDWQREHYKLEAENKRLRDGLSYIARRGYTGASHVALELLNGKVYPADPRAALEEGGGNG